MELEQIVELIVRVSACLLYTSSALGKSGPKARSKDVADGQQVDIPVLSYDRTVGTQKESLSRERENRCKRGRSRVGKSTRQSEDVMRSELK